MIELDEKKRIIQEFVPGKQVTLAHVDRFNGSLVITGDVAAVQSALTEVMNTLCGMMGFASAPITKT